MLAACESPTVALISMGELELSRVLLPVELTREGVESVERSTAKKAKWSNHEFDSD
jgi:hypothetical protein